MNVRVHTFVVNVLGSITRAAVAIARYDERDDLPGDTRPFSDADRWLTGEERSRFSSLRVRSARADMLAGRVAAKSALKTLLPDTSPDDWEIVRGVWHQPCVRGPKAGLAATLAHSGGTGIALVHDDRWLCGIDLECPSHGATETIAAEFAGINSTWIEGGTLSTEERGLVLWTTREAYGKLLRTGLLLPEILAPTWTWTPDRGGWAGCLDGTGLLIARSVFATPYVFSLVTQANVLESEVVEEIACWIVAALSQ